MSQSTITKVFSDMDFMKVIQSSDDEEIDSTKEYKQRLYDTIDEDEKFREGIVKLQQRVKSNEEYRKKQLERYLLSHPEEQDFHQRLEVSNQRLQTTINIMK